MRNSITLAVSSYATLLAISHHATAQSCAPAIGLAALLTWRLLEATTIKAGRLKTGRLITPFQKANLC
jgi:hypothetical protein